MSLELFELMNWALRSPCIGLTYVTRRCLARASCTSVHAVRLVFLPWAPEKMGFAGTRLGRPKHLGTCCLRK